MNLNSWFVSAFCKYILTFVALLLIGIDIAMAQSAASVELLTEYWVPDKRGCKLWVMAKEQPKELKWTGKCAGGYLSGKGAYTLSYADGTVMTYTGEMREGKRSGRGRITWTNGSQYEGEFANGKFDGKGHYKWARGDQYEGDFVQGERTGRGRFLGANGDQYEGDFVYGIYQGQGRMTKSNGEQYQGEFFNGKYSGRGRLTNARGNQYEGGFLDGYFSGSGKFIGDDVIIEGEFKNGFPHGKAKQCNLKGDCVEGQFVAGIIDGKAHVTSVDGIKIDAVYSAGTLVSTEPWPNDPDVEGHRQCEKLGITLINPGYSSCRIRMIQAKYDVEMRALQLQRLEQASRAAESKMWLDFAARMLRPTYVGPAPGSGPAGGGAAYGTAIYKNEQQSGMNKICYYDRVGSPVAITIGAAQLCPLTLQ